MEGGDVNVIYFSRLGFTPLGVYAECVETARMGEEEEKEEKNREKSRQKKRKRRKDAG